MLLFKANQAFRDLISAAGTALQAVRDVRRDVQIYADTTGSEPVGDRTLESGVVVALGSKQLAAETRADRDEVRDVLVPQAEAAAARLTLYEDIGEGSGAPSATAVFMDDAGNVAVGLTAEGKLVAFAGFEGPGLGGEFVRGYEDSSPVKTALFQTEDGLVPMVLNSDGTVSFPAGLSPETVALVRARIATGRLRGVPLEFDVFLIAGQSNAVGYGTLGSSPPAAPNGQAYWYRASDGALQQVAGVVGEGEHGLGASMWAEFAQQYYAATGRGAVLVPAAVGGAPLAALGPAGAADWSPTGRLLGEAVTDVLACFASLTGAGVSWRFRGVLWCQGEADGQTAGQTQATYQANLGGLTSRLRRLRTGGGLGPGTPLFVIQTGTNDNTPDGTSYEFVRTAQAAYCASDPMSHLVSASAWSFAARGLMGDLFHYTQAGYDELGACAARSVAACPHTCQ